MNWFVTVLACTAVFELLAVLAWKNEQHRLLDFTTAVITIPAGAVMLLVLASVLWAWLGKTSFVNSLGWSARLLPFAWAIPVFDLIRTFGYGLVIGPPKLNGLELFTASVTGGLLPIESGISIGIRLGIFAASIGVGIVTWSLGRKVWKAVIGGVIFSTVTVKCLSTLSILSLLRGAFRPEAWTALPIEIVRWATLAMSNGYWWNNVYERFPTAVDAQVAITARLVESAFVLVALGLLILIAFLAFRVERWNILRHVYRSWGTFDVLLYVAFGVLFAFQSVSMRYAGVTCWLAIGAFLLLLAALRFASVMRRDLAQISLDEQRESSQPALRGDLSIEGVKVFAKIAEFYALAVSWVLGWPLFACTLTFLAASHLTRSKLWFANVWAPIIFRAFGAGALALLGAYFVTQNAKITMSVLIIAAVAFVHRVFIEAFWMPRTGKGKVGVRGI